jgi:hypothetical protein
MLFDFFNYLHNNNLDDYLNCYSTFLLTKKDYKNNILKIRMNILIDTYIKFEKKNKFDYLYYYLNNYKDKFLDKPLINYEYNKHSIIDDDDDIDDHYKLMFIKNPEKKIIDYDELDKLYVEEELRKEEEKEYEKLCDLNDDEYYYEDDDCEYYEDNNIYDDEEYYYDEYY